MKTSLDELLAFSAVVAAGSISAAAQQLGHTASGLSRALSRLEERLDATLLQRTTRRLELTAEGNTFLAHHLLSRLPEQRIERHGLSLFAMDNGLDTGLSQTASGPVSTGLKGRSNKVRI